MFAQQQEGIKEQEPNTGSREAFLHANTGDWGEGYVIWLQPLATLFEINEEETLTEMLSLFQDSERESMVQI